MLKPVHTQLLACLHREPRLTRAQLHRRTGVRPNTVGLAVEELIEHGLLRFGPIRTTGRGPRHESIEIDDSRHHVAGLAIAPGRVEACRLNLRGEVTGDVHSRHGATAAQLLKQSVELAKEVADPRQCLGLGISVPGFIDAATRRVTTSSAFEGEPHVDLEELCEAAGVPVSLDSEIHAVATRWLLRHRQPADQAVLLVSLREGEIGASFLVNGVPVGGHLRAGNELGHTQFPVETQRCYCGQTGCIERIFSDAHYQRLGREPSPVGLSGAIARFGSHTDEALTEVTELLAMAIGNAVNFARPDRLVLAGELTAHPHYAAHLTERITQRVFPELAERMQVQAWPENCAASAETAGWLALSRVFGLRD